MDYIIKEKEIEGLRRSLLLGDTESSSSSARGLGVLTLDSESPEVSQTSVLLHLLHSLEVLSQLGVEGHGDQLVVGAISGVSLSVQVPLGNVEVSGSVHDVVDFFDFGLSKLSGSFVKVDLGDLEEQVGEPPSDTLDGSESKLNLVFSVNVSVLDTEDVDEIIRFVKH